VITQYWLFSFQMLALIGGLMLMAKNEPLHCSCVMGTGPLVPQLTKQDQHISVGRRLGPFQFRLRDLICSRRTGAVRQLKYASLEIVAGKQLPSSRRQLAFRRLHRICSSAAVAINPHAATLRGITCCDTHNELRRPREWLRQVLHSFQLICSG
jgi:hypothetical protein